MPRTRIQLTLGVGLLLTLLFSLPPHCSSQSSEPPTTTAQNVTTEEVVSTDPTSGSTEAPSETTTTTTAPLTKSTTVPTTVSSTKIPIIIPDTSSHFFCPCDYYLHSCEFNCCCDPNCSDKEKANFTNCVDEESIRKFTARRDSRRCYKRDFLYRNRTMYRTEIPQPGLFCVIAQNLNKEEEFPAATVNLTRIAEDSKAKYSWQSGKQVDEEIHPRPKHYYVYGDQILVVNFTGKPAAFEEMGMALPSTAFDSECNAKNPVTFLQDQVSLCELRIFNLPLQCETTPILNPATFLQDLFVVQNPSLNYTEDHYLVEFTYLNCPPYSPNENSGCVETLNLLSPTYDPATSECLNVLKELTFVFKHVGVGGIVHVMAHIHYSNHLAVSTTKISQKFSAIFEWERPREDKVHHHPPGLISGYQGYNIGSAVLIGTSEKLPNFYVTNKTTGEEKEALETLVRRKLIINPNFRAMTVLSPQSCLGLGERKPLQFGYDSTVNCFLDKVNLSSSCQDLQLEIGKIFLGMHPKDLSRSYVAAIGNPDPGMSSHWIELLTSGEPFKDTGSSFKSIESGCDGILTTMSIHFLYAHVGDVQLPKLQILAVLLEFGGSTHIPRRDSNSTSSIFLTTTAKFTDVTPPPVTPYPKWPIISIKLPQDFFYPFSIVSSTGSVTGPIGFPIVILQFFVILKSVNY